MLLIESQVVIGNHNLDAGDSASTAMAESACMGSASLKEGAKDMDNVVLSSTGL
jgi:hypothetical protein